MNHVFRTSIVICLTFFICLPAWAAPAKITLTNGLSQLGDVASANENGVMWRARDQVAPRLIAHNTIARIDFAAPQGWDEANGSYYAGDYQNAIAAFTSFANNPRAHYYPAPGNYASLAMLRLIDCYRETGNAAEITRLVKRLDPNSLAIHKRGKLETLECWAAFGESKWGEALKKIEAIEANPLTPGSADRAFIKGVALENTGKPEEAIIAYAGAYSLEFGGQSGIAKRAMYNAANLLEKIKIDYRLPEHRALVHTYAHIFNSGEIWDKASPVSLDLLAEKLDLGPDEMKDGESLNSPVMLVRFRQSTVLQRGSSKTFTYTPDPKDEPVKATSINGIASPGSALTVEASNADGIIYQRNNGLGLVSGGDDSFTFSVSGVDAFRVVSVTFGGGNREYKLNRDDEVKVTVDGLEGGQKGYAKDISGKLKENEDDNFRRIGMSGGFIRADGGSFTLSHGSGSFGIDAIALELKVKKAGAAPLMPTAEEIPEQE